MRPQVVWRIVGLAAGVCAVGAFPAPTSGDDEPNCGYVLDSVCPGCTPTNPGGCGCLPENGACNCKPAGFKVECYSGNFTYVSDPNGYILVPGEKLLCSRVLMCMMSNGSTVNCATYSEGACPQPPPPNQPCQWRLFGNPNEQPEWQHAESCLPPET